MFRINRLTKKIILSILTLVFIVTSSVRANAGIINQGWQLWNSLNEYEQEAIQQRLPSGNYGCIDKEGKVKFVEWGLLSNIQKPYPQATSESEIELLGKKISIIRFSPSQNDSKNLQDSWQSIVEQIPENGFCDPTPTPESESESGIV